MDTDTFDRRLLEADLASCRASHAALVGWLRSLDGIDPSAATSLPGWSIGHVLTHVARNADSHIDMLDGRPQYPSPASRGDDITSGAGRRWSELVEDVTTSAAALDARWEGTHDWSGTAAMLAGSRPRHLLPLLRQREVEVHRSDLGLGYGFADMPARYVRRDLLLMEMLWRARKPMGLTGLPEAARRLAPPDRLAWMMGRVDVDGLPPADLF